MIVLLLLINRMQRSLIECKRQLLSVKPHKSILSESVKEHIGKDMQWFLNSNLKFKLTACFVISIFVTSIWWYMDNLSSTELLLRFLVKQSILPPWISNFPDVWGSVEDRKDLISKILIHIHLFGCYLDQPFGFKLSMSHLPSASWWVQVQTPQKLILVIELSMS